MLTALSIIGLILGAVAVTGTAWAEWFPRQGPVLLYRQRELRLALVIAMFALTLGAYAVAPDMLHLAGVGLAMLVALAAAITQPRVAWIAQDNPRHRKASEATLPDNESMIGAEVGEAACAWPAAALLAHHVVNDVVNGTPVAAVY